MSLSKSITAAISLLACLFFTACENKTDFYRNATYLDNTGGDAVPDSLLVTDLKINGGAAMTESKSVEVAVSASSQFSKLDGICLVAVPEGQTAAPNPSCWNTMAPVKEIVDQKFPMALPNTPGKYQVFAWAKNIFSTNSDSKDSGILFNPLNRRDVAIAVNELPKPLVKLFLIVDNSNSMEWNQKNLAQAMDKLLQGLQNSNIEFYIYTTAWTSQGSTLPTTKITNLFSYLDPKTNQMVTTTSGVIPQEVTKYNLLQQNVLNAPYNNNGAKLNLKLKMGMSQAEFNSVKAAVKEAVTNIGAVGRGVEAGLCSIAAILADTTLNQIKPDDKVAFLVMSDADDYTASASTSCWKSYLTNRTKLPVYDYRVDFVKSRKVQLDYPCPGGTCSYTLPLARAVQSGMTDEMVLSAIPRDANGQPDFTVSNCPQSLSCMVDASKPETQKFKSLFSYMARTIGVNEVGVKGCQITCQLNSNTPQSKQIGLHRDSAVGNETRDYCSSPFTYGKVTYPNIVEYYEAIAPESDVVPGSCTRTALEGSRADSYVLTTFKEVLTPPPPTAHLGAAINRHLKERLGARNYWVAAIVHDDQIESEMIKAGKLPAACSASQGQGTQYRKWIDDAGTQGSIYPVCSVDYSPAMAGVNDWIKDTYKLKYPLGLVRDEKVLKVVINRGGTQIEVAPSDYSVTAGEIAFRFEYPFMIGDSLSIQIEGHVLPL